MKSMINNIKQVFTEIKIEYTTSLSQKISSNEFINILTLYDISYPKSDIDNLLMI